MQSAITIYLLFVIWLNLFVSSSTFLLSSECPAQPPCLCILSSGYSITIRCDSKSLTAVPQFGVVNASFNYFAIYLQYNSITTIPNNAFRNLSSIEADGIAIYLDNNRLYTMESNAFVGFENVTNLHLNNNNFTTIPAAISTLKQLQYLSIQDNPLKSLDHFVLSSIGNNLISFEFDVNLFTEWPGAELRLFAKLQSLTADKIPFSRLDANAFLGFENTLTSLTMNSARLVKIPNAICQLTRLTYLTFGHDSKLSENTSFIFGPCGHSMHTLISLDLSADNLLIFSDVFSLFPSIISLDASYNRFEYIDSSKIPSGSKLGSISLNGNLFERIPSALYKLKFLTSVSLSNNKIKTVEIFDLNSLSKLQELHLDGNPLVYISTDAFSHNPEISYLSLKHTQLDHIPQDVTHLSNLKTLYLSGRPIECTCDMSYLKHWNVSDVTEFSTPCASSTETIKTFIMTSLQTCT